MQFGTRDHRDEALTCLNPIYLYLCVRQQLQRLSRREALALKNKGLHACTPGDLLYPPCPLGGNGKGVSEIEHFLSKGITRLLQPSAGVRVGKIPERGDTPNHAE